MGTLLRGCLLALGAWTLWFAWQLPTPALFLYSLDVLCKSANCVLWHQTFSFIKWMFQKTVISPSALSWECLGIKSVHSNGYNATKATACCKGTGLLRPGVAQLLGSRERGTNSITPPWQSVGVGTALAITRPICLAPPRHEQPRERKMQRLLVGGRGRKGRFPCCLLHSLCSVWCRWEGSHGQWLSQAVLIILYQVSTK